MAILVGSEARSYTLIVAVFLLGLSAGYWAFGLLTEKRKWSRCKLMKVYGYVELLTALYIAGFSVYFSVLKYLSFNSPPLFIMDVVIALLALFLPTFLMGASIPVLTAVLPNTSEEINTIHSRVYGWNTLGASLGILVSGFYFLPVFGFGLTLIIAGVLNLLSAVVFMGNKLKGDVRKSSLPPVVTSNVPGGFYFAFTFLTGAVIISFEILFVRVLNLTVGAGAYNFPMILSIFVGGLAVGSLSIKKNKISGGYLIRQMAITAFLMVCICAVVPYWSIWMNHIRIMLTSLPVNYIIFKLLIFCFFFVFLFPAVFFMGRLLPLTYALLNKNQQNYGRVCGLLYFFNTLGTVIGAVVGGYLAFYLFDLDWLFKINILILILLGIALILYEKRFVSFSALILLVLSVAIFGVKWDREGHYVGYFRVKKYKPERHFKKLFFLHPRKRAKIGYFKDGPNSTVTNIFYNKKDIISRDIKNIFPIKNLEHYSYTIVVNGKSDSNNLGDFSTVFLLSALPYLFMPPVSAEGGEGLSAAVVGLGTGVSAGVLGQVDDVKQVMVMEISPAVIEAVSVAPPAMNFSVLKNSKVRIVPVDAFKYFTRTRKTFDIIVSEPPNLWVAGVENLFSVEFYKLAWKSLSDEGVFSQWLHAYDLDNEEFAMVLHTLTQVFPYVEVYQIGGGDMAILARKRPFSYDFMEQKLSHPFLAKYYQSIGLWTSDDVHIVRVFNQWQVNQIVAYVSSGVQSLTFPRLTYRADKSFFMGTAVQPFELAPGFIIDDVQQERLRAFETLVQLSPDRQNRRCFHIFGFNFSCQYTNKILLEYGELKKDQESSLARFEHYLYLRKRRLILGNESFLDEVFKNILQNGSDVKKDVFLSYVDQRLGHRQYERALADVDLLLKARLMDAEKWKSIRDYIHKVRTMHKRFLPKVKQWR